MKQLTATERRLAYIVYRYLRTSDAALEEYRRFLKREKPKREGLADVDADARKLMDELVRKAGPYL